MGERPDVSVIVIAYNDAARLPHAVDSVLAQSLGTVETVIVDDASTDGTAEVADRLGAAHPGRVRAVHLPENSGGCSRPRNTGIERARGTYVMFLDSDDVLDRHACLNLVSTAEETGADLVSGLCVRVRLDRATGRERAWYPWLYQRRAVHESIMEIPDLLYDTLSTNKCYRRDFLIEHRLRFPEGLHYEDLLFSAQAYLAAGRLALIPHRVYTWNAEEKAEHRSISNRRAELRNFADRLEIHRRIDATFRGCADAQAAGDLKLIKDAKFVNHDLLLYLRELRSREPGYQARFLELAGSYVAELDPRVFERANPIPSIAAFLVGRGDLDGALAAAEYGRSKVPELRTDLVERDGRVYWGDRHLGDEEARRVLDVTGLGIHATPLSRLRLANTLSTADSSARLAGHVSNPLGGIPADAELTGTLEFFDRRRRSRIFRAPAEVAHAGDRINWSAAFAPARRVHPIGFVDPVWDVRLRLTVDGQETTSRLSPAPGLPPLALPVRPRLTRLAGDRLESYVTDWGHLSFSLAGRGRWATAARTAVERAARTSTGRRAWARIRGAERSVLRTITGRKTKLAVYDRLLTRLPIRRGTVVFESHLGARYSDSPRAIFEELRRRSAAPPRAIWSYASNPRGFPKDAARVRRGSWPYYLALARAEFWVDNQGFPEGLRKRRGTTYIQTWHGSAFKRMGFDQPQLKAAGLAEQRRLRRMVDRFDHFVVRSEHDARTLARGLGVDAAKLLPVGYPRNDALVNGADPVELRKLRRTLGLADDDHRQIVLYAPTFRTDLTGRPAKRFELPFDPVRFAAELGGTHVLLVRPHYLCTVALPPGTRHAVRNVGGIPDITPLLLLADALITDYSSVMFDYALLDRPMIFYVPDEEDYVGQTRGSYFELAEHAPGPVLDDEAALLAALSDLGALRTAFAARRREFTARFGEHDHGTASRQIVDRFLLEGAGRDR